MARPRVLIATDQLGGLDSRSAGQALATGFAPHAEVAVVPLATGGTALAAAVAGLGGGERHDVGAGWWQRLDEHTVLIGYQQPARPAWVPDATTTDLGQWVARVLAAEPASDVVLDLTGVTAHDGGAGLWESAADVLAGRTLVGLVAAEEIDLPATGLTGGLARRAYAVGVDVAEVLGADTRLKEWATRLGENLAVAPGGGAAGGCGLVVLAQGGRLLSGQDWCAQLARMDASLALADLVVTGCTELSALDRGGPIVAAVSAWAEQALRPCVLFTTGAGLARRELRTLGIESAHLVDAPVGVTEIAAAAARVAAGWR